MQISSQVFSWKLSDTCTHTINWTPNNQAYEDPVPSDDRTYFLIFPDLTHDFLTDRRILCPSRQCNPLRFTLNLPTRWRGYVCTVCVSTGVILTVLWSERVWSIYSSLGSSVSEKKDFAEHIAFKTPLWTSANRSKAWVWLVYDTPHKDGSGCKSELSIRYAKAPDWVLRTSTGSSTGFWFCRKCVSRINCKTVLSETHQKFFMV